MSPAALAVLSMFGTFGTVVAAEREERREPPGPRKPTAHDEKMARRRARKLERERKKAERK